MAGSGACPHIRDCELYPLFSLKGALKIWQMRYCEHPVRHTQCERYKRSQAGEPVPANLLPNGEEIAR